MVWDLPARYLTFTGAIKWNTSFQCPPTKQAWANTPGKSSAKTHRKPDRNINWEMSTRPWSIPRREKQSCCNMMYARPGLTAACKPYAVLLVLHKNTPCLASHWSPTETLLLKEKHWKKYYPAINILLAPLSAKKHIVEVCQTKWTTWWITDWYTVYATAFLLTWMYTMPPNGPASQN